jgi:hypothetical protein
MPVARRSRPIRHVSRLFRLFALTAAPLAVELFAPVVAHAAESTPSSTSSPKKDAKSSSSKKESKTTPAHRHRATAMANEHDRDRDRGHHSTDVKVDVHIDGSGKKRVTPEARPKKERIVDVEVEPPQREQERERDREHARRVSKEAHVGRGEHAVEPDRSPKVEATLDPTIHFVPMSATTLTPIDVSVDVKTSGDDKPAKKSDKADKAAKPDPSDGIAPQLLRKIEDKPIDGKTTPAGKSKKDKKVESKCLNSAIDVFRGVEEEKVALTKCNGELAPGAVELMSILVRPGSASRPIASLDELMKEHTKEGGEIAPGVKRIDGALVRHLQQVIEHFAHRAAAGVAKKDQAPRVFVISGYRPGSKGSFHQSGKALDFRLDGVKNEDLVAFCKTLPDVGCGYYPNSSFVHMDVRAPGTGHVAWIDASGPGESPNYVASWPPPADKMDRKANKSDLADNEPESESIVDAAATSAIDAKAPKTVASRGKHVGPFDLPPLPDEERAADPEAVSDMSQPAADIPASNDE